MSKTKKATASATEATEATTNPHIHEDGEVVDQRPRKAKKVASKKSAKKPAKKAAKPSTKKAAKPSKKASKKASKPAAREGSRKATVVALISRKGGATLPEIMNETGWQAHSVRGLISTLGKNGLKIESDRSDAGDRTYHAHA